MFTRIIHGIIVKLKYSFNSRIKIDFFRIPVSSKIDLSKESTVIIKKINIYPYVNIRVRGKAKLLIGVNTFFNNGCIITSRNSIEIGNNVLVGPNVMFFDHNHDYKSDDIGKNFVTGTIKIGDNTWIGANAVILKDANIGSNCVIAAGVTVSNINIPDNSIYFGNGVIKKIER